MVMHIYFFIFHFIFLGGRGAVNKLHYGLQENGE